MLIALQVPFFRIEDDVVVSEEHADDLVQLIENELLWPTPG